MNKWVQKGENPHSWDSCYAHGPKAQDWTGVMEGLKEGWGLSLD